MSRSTLNVPTKLTQNTTEGLKRGLNTDICQCFICFELVEILLVKAFIVKEIVGEILEFLPCNAFQRGELLGALDSLGQFIEQFGINSVLQQVERLNNHRPSHLIFTVHTLLDVAEQCFPVSLYAPQFCPRQIQGTAFVCYRVVLKYLQYAGVASTELLAIDDTQEEYRLDEVGDISNLLSTVWNLEFIDFSQCLFEVCSDDTVDCTVLSVRMELTLGNEWKFVPLRKGFKHFNDDIVHSVHSN